MRWLGWVAAVSIGMAGLAAPAAAQEATGRISGRVFFQNTGQGGGGRVWVQALRMPGPVEARGTCVDGFEYEIAGLQPGTYKVRFGFGCGADRDREPHEWFVQTSAPECAADVIVVAGYTTDGVNADVDPQRGPEYQCDAERAPPPPSQVGVQRPIAGPTASPQPTGEVSFQPGVMANPAPSTPAGVVVGAAVALALAVAGFLIWVAWQRSAR